MTSRRDFMAGCGAGLATAIGAAAVAKRAHDATQPSWPGKLSFAQAGEDHAAYIVFEMLDQALPGQGFLPVKSHLDIGAFDPVFHNNTYLFYRAGSRGVLVEPNTELVDKLKRERPGDTVLNAGIGAGGKSEADFYMMENPGLNTFSKEDAEEVERQKLSRIKKVVRMPLLDINDLMQEHWGGPPALVSIDTEGFDLPILKSLDFERYRPTVFCVETLAVGTLQVNPEIGQFMAGKGYLARGGSMINTLFVDGKLLGPASGVAGP